MKRIARSLIDLFEVLLGYGLLVGGRVVCSELRLEVFLSVDGFFFEAEEPTVCGLV
jgi:hypothetical protein